MFTDCLQLYPTLSRFTEKLITIPQLKSYLDSDKRQPFPSAETQYVQTVHRVLGRI